jgi:perosamine synthetase
MIPVAEPLLGEEELKNVIEAVKSGWISSRGKFIPEFESGFAKYCGVRHGIATSNGTTALHLALTALGIGTGDEVIVPTLTFIATANVVTYTGAKPVFVDCCPDYWCIDPSKIEDKITSKTKAIIPVHLYGHPCDMNSINDIAMKHKLFVIEDAAEAHGAEYKGKKVGSLSDVACFSFYGNKIITTGEGGMCLTCDDNLAQKMQILRDHGKSQDRAYWHEVIGFNYRMTNLQAAIGVAQLAKIDSLIAKRREIANRYMEALQKLSSSNILNWQVEMQWAKSVYWMFSIILSEQYGLSNIELGQKLLEKGIETRPLFYPLNIMPPYSHQETFPVAEGLSKKGLTLPSGYKINSEDITEICKQISLLNRTKQLND